MNKHIYFDGKKSIELSQYPDEAWTWLTGEPDDGKTGIKEYFKAVPWLFRGVSLRANAVSKMPFEIYKGDGEDAIDASDKYENVVKFMPNPKRTLRLIEMSLALMGVAYLFNVRNQVVTLDLKYLNPTTIEPIIDESNGLLGFKRTLTTTTKYEVEDIIHLWLEDPYVELGEPNISPAKAALMASGVLANVDEFVAAFFQRGAIKATIFSAQGMSRDSATEFENWWTKFVTGVQNSWRTKVLNAEAMEPTVIGEGIEGLQDQDLTKEKREDIATALGIPQSLLWSSEAGGLGGAGVVSQDDYHFYDKTIVPECEFIQYVLNEQVFEPAGYRLKFLPETIDIMQEDEKARSMALGYLFNAEVPLDIAMKILGFEMDEEYWKRIEEQVKKKEEQAEELVGQLTQGGNSGGGAAFQPRDPKDKPDPFVEKSLGDDLEQWKDKAINYMKRGKPGKGRKYESENIPPSLEGAISGALEEAETEDEIAAVFADIWMGYP
jgi:HK97 family phage portal protein